MGRPPKSIDGDQVRKLARLGLTQRDIAEFFECAQSTISERFRSQFHVGTAQSKISVRRLMWGRARAGADTILLRLDDRCFGLVGRQLLADEGEVLEALDDGDDIPAGLGQGEASGTP